VNHDLQEEGAGPADSVWVSSRTVWLSGLLLIILLLCLIPAIDHGATVSPDEGVYAAQAELLASGSWSAARPATQLELPAGRDAIKPDFVDGDRYIPYPRHPVYSVLLAPFFRWGGLGGMLVLSALGTAAAAVAAGLLAWRLDRRFGLPALWILGLGSPLLFDAYFLAAHSLGAAMFGFVVLGVSDAVDKHRLISLVYALPALVLLVGLRSEGVIAGVSLGAVVGLMALSATFRTKVDWSGAFLGSVVVAVAGAAYLLDARLAQAVVGSSTSIANPSERVLGEATGPVSAIWISLFRPWTESPIETRGAVLLCLLSVVLAAIVLRWAPKQALLAVGLLVLAAVTAVIHVSTPVDLISGLFAAFPLLGAGLLLIRWGDLADPLVVRLIGISAISMVVLALTIYADGGAVQWGGRFFHVLLPALVPLVILGLARARDALDRPMARVATAAVCVVTCCFSVTALHANSKLREANRDLVDQTEQFARRDSGSGLPLVVVARLKPDGTSRVYWNELDRLDIVSANGVQDLFKIIDHARRVGYRSVVTVTDAPLWLFVPILTEQHRDLGWSVLGAHAVTGPGPRLWLYRLGD